MRLAHLLPRSVAALALAALVVPAGATAAKPRDRDRDRMPDKWEVAHKLSSHRNDARKDADRDGLKNLAEYRAHTDPRDADSDDDGIKDGKERAGTVVSLAGGVLTLTLFDGSELSAKVDDRTEVECAEPDDTPAPVATRRDRDDDSRTDDDDHEDEDDDDRPGHEDEDEDHDDDGEDHEEADCGLADLKPGARVDEAQLALNAAGKRFTEIELG